MDKQMCTVTLMRNGFELTIFYGEQGYEISTVKTASQLITKLCLINLPVIFSPKAIQHLAELLSPNLDLT